MSKKIAQKNFRFTEQTMNMLEEIVELEKQMFLEENNLEEHEVRFFNQTFVIEVMIRERYTELRKMIRNQSEQGAK